MRDLIANEDFGAGGCLAVGCLLVLLGGGLVSLVFRLGLGSPGEEAFITEPTQQASTARQSGEGARRDEPVDPAPRERTRSEPVRREPATEGGTAAPTPTRAERNQEPRCAPLLDAIQEIVQCEAMPTGHTRGPTVFLRVEGGRDRPEASILLLDAYRALPSSLRNHTGGLALETSGATYMVDPAQVDGCLGDRSPAGCVGRAVTRFTN